MTLPDLESASFSTGSVISADGTRIGYRQLGQGPGLVLTHGSMQSAASHLGLAAALADVFTIYLPDRRGRGMSGPYGDSYGIHREVEDLAALLDATGARNAYGISASGLAVLEAARTLTSLDKIAVYEPAITEASSPHTEWLVRFDREMAAGKVAAAMVTALIGLQLGSPALNVMPRWLLVAFTNMALRGEAKKLRPGDISTATLAATLHYEGQLIAEMTGSADRFSTIKADVLLMSGTKGLPYLKPELDRLQAALPQARRVDFAGLDHGAPADRSQLNEGGKPEAVTAVIREFFLAGS